MIFAFVVTSQDGVEAVYGRRTKAEEHVREHHSGEVLVYDILTDTGKPVGHLSQDGSMVLWEGCKHNWTALVDTENFVANGYELCSACGALRPPETPSVGCECYEDHEVCLCETCGCSYIFGCVRKGRGGPSWDRVRRDGP